MWIHNGKNYKHFLLACQSRGCGGRQDIEMEWERYRGRERKKEREREREREIERRSARENDREKERERMIERDIQFPSATFKLP